MADAMVIEADAERLLQVMARVGDRAQARVEAASLETAVRVADEMRRRIARSGLTHKGTDVPTHTKIHHEKARGGRGYVVMAYDTGGKGAGGRTLQHHVDRYLEHGTKFMPAQPFLWVSAEVEEGAHRRRVEDAIMDTLAEVEG